MARPIIRVEIVDRGERQMLKVTELDSEPHWDFIEVVDGPPVKVRVANIENEFTFYVEATPENLRRYQPDT